MYFQAPPLLPRENAHDSIAWRAASTLLCRCSTGQIYTFLQCKALFNKRLSGRRRCNRDKIRLKLIKDWYSTFEDLESWRGVSGVRCKLQTLQTRGQATNDQKIELKWSLDRSFTAHNKVKTFRNGFLSAYFNLMWVKTSEGTKFYVRLATSKLTAEGQISAFLTDFVKLSRRY